jgi:hypothetical protein
MSVPRSVTAENLGAWLIKGNADHVDLAARFAREPRVDRWCVRPGYRLGLMRAGQPVLFWASGSRRRDLTYGIWGWGRLAGPAGSGEVPLDLVIAERRHRLSRDVLRADRELAGLEVLRQPQGSNPSFVTAGELDAIRRHWTAAGPD